MIVSDVIRQMTAVGHKQQTHSAWMPTAIRYGPTWPFAGVLMSLVIKIFIATYS